MLLSHYRLKKPKKKKDTYKRDIHQQERNMLNRWLKKKKGNRRKSEMFQYERFNLIQIMQEWKKAFQIDQSFIIKKIYDKLQQPLLRFYIMIILPSIFKNNTLFSHFKWSSY